MNDEDSIREPIRNGLNMNRYVSFVAPALLVAVAVTQLYNGTQRNLTPWKGGGFGMFSSVDAPPLRTLRVALISDAGEIEVALPDYLQREVVRATNFPTQRSLAILAGRMRAVDYSSPYPIPGVAAGDSAMTAGVTVEVWRLRAFHDPMTLSMELISADTVLYDSPRPIHSAEWESQ